MRSFRGQQIGRATVRRLLEMREREAGANQPPISLDNAGAPENPPPDSGGDLSELRGRLLCEAARLSAATKRTLGSLVREAAKGAFTLATLRTLPGSEACKVEAALRELERMAVAR